MVTVLYTNIAAVSNVSLPGSISLFLLIYTTSMSLSHRLVFFSHNRCMKHVMNPSVWTNKLGRLVAYSPDDARL